MKKYVVIKTAFPALHRYPDNKETSTMFLQFTHRHVFHVTVKYRVEDNNREVEFLKMKELIDKYIQRDYAYKNMGSKSCEDICDEIACYTGAVYVSVFEDNENGAEVSYEENNN